MLEAVLFDWGDTLMSYEWNPEVRLGGVDAGRAALAGRPGIPEAEAIARWFDERRREERLQGEDDEIELAAVLRACFSELGCELGDDDVRLYMQASHESWSSGYEVGAAAHALLESLRDRGLRLAIVSNTVQPEWLLRPVLERQGLVERVDAVVLSSEVGKRKPHPAIFEAALDRLGVRPEAAMHVGDKLREDVSGAAALGMTTVQAVWFHADTRDGVEPDFEAFTPMDVLNVVRRLRGER